jgi:hypothetical protein
MSQMQKTGIAVAAILLAVAVAGNPAVAAPKAKAQFIEADLKTACDKGGSLAFDGISGSHAQARRDAGCPVYSPAPIIPRWGKPKNQFAWVW